MIAHSRDDGATPSKADAPIKLFYTAIQPAINRGGDLLYMADRIGMDLGADRAAVLLRLANVMTLGRTLLQKDSVADEVRTQIRVETAALERLVHLAEVGLRGGAK